MTEVQKIVIPARLTALIAVFYMLTFHIITVGKLKESYWQEACSEYVKRLQSSAKIIIHELKEESFTDKDPVEHIKQKESIKILAELDKIKDAYRIVLDERGKKYSSVDFANHIAKISATNSSIIFIIGGPLGLDPAVTKLASETLSFSSFTFTHQMIRVILLEQIYRAAMIHAGRRYHY